jgi:hypothetical protein
MIGASTTTAESAASQGTEQQRKPTLSKSRELLSLYPLVRQESYPGSWRWRDCYQAMRSLYITNSNFILRESWGQQKYCIHHWRNPNACGNREGRARCGVDRGSGCRDTGWRTRIKGGGCCWFRIGELDANVILVMDSIWVLLEVAFLAMWYDWPPCYSVAPGRGFRGDVSVVVTAKWVAGIGLA